MYNLQIRHVDESPRGSFKQRSELSIQYENADDVIDIFNNEYKKWHYDYNTNYSKCKLNEIFFDKEYPFSIENLTNYLKTDMIREISVSKDNLPIRYMSCISSINGKNGLYSAIITIEINLN